jgi:MraZ protein
VASVPFRYNGPDFSLRGDKNRFVLPALFRSTVIESSGGMVVCLGKDEKHTCIVGYGISRQDEMLEQFDREAEAALEKGLPFDAVQRGMALFSVVEVKFDGSGRFILPDSIMKAANIEDQLYFQGAGRFFTAWNPDELYKMEGPGWEGSKQTCASLQAAHLAKAKSKAKTGAKRA